DLHVRARAALPVPGDRARGPDRTGGAMATLRSSLFKLTLVALVAVARGTAQQPARACVTPTPACEQWITLGGGPGRSMVYSSYPLDRTNPAITRALIMVHGAGRNADHYFETAVAAAFLAGALDNTIVIAPRYAAGRDTLHANEITWPEG